MIANAKMATRLVNVPLLALSPGMSGKLLRVATGSANKAKDAAGSYAASLL